MKIQLKKELKLTKDSISKLQESQMASIRGGRGGANASSSGPNCTCDSGTTCTSKAPEA